MDSSTNRLILIGVGVAVLGVAAYYTFSLLNEDSALGQRARSQLGLDKNTGDNILKTFQDPRLTGFKPNPAVTKFVPGYKNTTKNFIEDPNTPDFLREGAKKLELKKAQDYFGKANAGFSYAVAVEEQRSEPLVHSQIAN